MRNLIIVTWQDLKNLIKNPMWIFMALFFPIMLISILGFLTNDNYTSQFSSYDYYGITILVYFITLNCTFSANAFLEEKIKKANMRIIYSPCKDSFIYLSKIISSFIFCGVCNIATLAFTYFIFGLNLNGVPSILVILLFLNLLSVSVGVLFCCIYKSELIVNTLLSTIVSLSAVFAGVWFPLEGAGPIMARVTNFSPSKWVINVLFSIIYDNDYNGFIPIVIGMFLLIAITIFLCKLTFKKEEFV